MKKLRPCVFHFFEKFIFSILTYSVLGLKNKMKIFQNNACFKWKICKSENLFTSLTLDRKEKYLI